MKRFSGHLHGASSKKRSGQIYFTEDNLFPAISKSHNVWFHVVNKALRTYCIS